MSSWSIACQVGQLRVELVKLHVNYAKREHQSQLESHPANIFPMNIYINYSINPPQLKNKYFTSKLVVVILFIYTLVKYSLNYLSTLPVRNKPIYTTWSIAIGNFTPSCVILKCIYIRNPLSFNLFPINRLINSNLILATPILLTLSLSILLLLVI